ncbi:hypothetical protein [Kitasatospora sp. NPDC092286]|uniref:hypothetical protein n=1 Tax=Kitasatospora sp. NPDC092286 TaxID=3364087 RepID=UPI0037F14A90
MESHADQRLRHLYTGDSVWYIARTARDRSPGIEEANADQALIEHLFLSEVRGGAAYAQHPVSIRATRVLDGRTEVFLDKCAIGTRGKRYDFAEEALCRLLPFGVDDGELAGVCGLRVSHIDSRGIHLRLVQAPAAHLTLVGPTAAHWKQLVAEHHKAVSAAGSTPLWDRQRYGEAEHAFHARHPKFGEHEAGMSLLTSGILRRIGMWHTTSNAFCTRYWQAGHQTMVWELRHLYGTRPAHDEFAALFRKPLWGPPLVVLKQHCDCHSRRPDAGGRPHPDFERQCTFEFHHQDRPGVLEIRFRTGRPRNDDEPEVRADLEAAGADPAWLGRVLPRRKILVPAG